MFFDAALAAQFNITSDTDVQAFFQQVGTNPSDWNEPGDITNAAELPSMWTPGGETLRRKQALNVAQRQANHLQKTEGAGAALDLGLRVAQAMTEALAGVNQVEVWSAMKGTQAAGFYLTVNGSFIPFEGPTRPNAREILGAWFGLDISEYDSNP